MTRCWTCRSQNHNASYSPAILPAISVSYGSGFIERQPGAEYTIKVCDAGEVASTGSIAIVATIPAGLTTGSFASTGWTYVLATLARGADESLRVGDDCAV
jgi:hypothetical protein